MLIGTSSFAGTIRLCTIILGSLLRPRGRVGHRERQRLVHTVRERQRPVHMDLGQYTVPLVEVLMRHRFHRACRGVSLRPEEEEQAIAMARVKEAVKRRQLLVT